MIDKNTLTLKWINEISNKNRKVDKILIEKVIRALYLLEGLSKVNLNFVFKGGTALILLMDEPRRLSIDIDIIIEEHKKLDELFEQIIE